MHMHLMGGGYRANDSYFRRIAIKGSKMLTLTNENHVINNHKLGFISFILSALRAIL